MVGEQATKALGVPCGDGVKMVWGRPDCANNTGDAEQGNVAGNDGVRSRCAPVVCQCVEDAMAASVGIRREKRDQTSTSSVASFSRYLT